MLTPEQKFIIGPQLSTGDYFDQTLLSQARKYGEAFPATPPPPDQMDAYVLMNYYDLGRSEYAAYERSEDLAFRDYGRKVADSWYACSYFKNGAERNPDNNTSPKFAGLAGLMLRALDGRPEMWDSINYWTRYYFDLWIHRRMNAERTAPDPTADVQLREAAFSLSFATWLVKVLPNSFPLINGDIAANGVLLRAKYRADIENATINYFGKLQQPDGSYRWDDWYSTGPDGSLLKGIMQPFMVGMLTRALCDVHELTSDIVVQASCRRQILTACRHLYSDGPFTRQIVPHFNVELGGFHYAYHGGTELNPTLWAKGDFPFDTTTDWHVASARQLMGTTLGSYAYAYKISGDEFFKRAGEEMYKYAYSSFDGFRAMMNDTAKNFNQHVMGTSCYKAWMGGVVGQPQPQPQPIPEPLPQQPTPQPPAPEPVKVPSPDGFKGIKIIDTALAEWTLSPKPEQRTLRNGIPIGGGQGQQYKLLGGVVYVWGLDNDWYRWSDLANSWMWFSKTEPGVVAQPPTPEPQPVPVPPQPTPIPVPIPAPPAPTPAPVPPRTVPYPSAKQLAKRNAVLEAQWRERYRLARENDNGTATFEKVS